MRRRKKEPANDKKPSLRVKANTTHFVTDEEMRDFFTNALSEKQKKPIPVSTFIHEHGKPTRITHEMGAAAALDEEYERLRQDNHHDHPQRFTAVEEAPMQDIPPTLGKEPHNIHPDMLAGLQHSKAVVAEAEAATGLTPKQLAEKRKRDHEGYLNDVAAKQAEALALDQPAHECRNNIPPGLVAIPVIGKIKDEKIDQRLAASVREPQHHINQRDEDGKATNVDKEAEIAQAYKTSHSQLRADVAADEA